jgi:hypothetical protein
VDIVNDGRRGVVARIKAESRQDELAERLNLYTFQIEWQHAQLASSDR